MIGQIFDHYDDKTKDKKEKNKEKKEKKVSESPPMKEANKEDKDRQSKTANFFSGVVDFFVKQIKDSIKESLSPDESEEDYQEDSESVESKPIDPDFEIGETTTSEEELEMVQNIEN